MGWCSATPTRKSSTMHELNVEYMNINAVNTETNLNIQMHGKHKPNQTSVWLGFFYAGQPYDVFLGRLCRLYVKNWLARFHASRHKTGIQFKDNQSLEQCVMGAPFHHALLDTILLVQNWYLLICVMGIVSLYNYIQGVYYG